MEDMFNFIVEHFIGIYHDKIDKKLTLQKHYETSNIDELKLLLGTYILVKDDRELLDEVDIEIKDKDKIINYLIEDTNDLYYNILTTVDDNFIKQLSQLIEENGYLSLEKEELFSKYTVGFLMTLKKYKMAQINCNLKKNIIKVQIPDCLINTISRLLEDPKSNKKRKENNIITSATRKILGVYGVLTMEKLTEIINEVFIKVTSKRLGNILSRLMITDEQINIFKQDNLTLVAGLEFSEKDEAFEFYESLSDGDYKIFTKEEYEELNEGYYHQKFSAYENLINYVEETWNLDEEELEDFEELFILDYLNSYKYDVELANDNLMEKLKKHFNNVTLQDKMVIKKNLVTLGKLYPNFYLKGYAKKEENIKKIGIN